MIRVTGLGKREMPKTSMTRSNTHFRAKYGDIESQECKEIRIAGKLYEFAKTGLPVDVETVPCCFPIMEVETDKGYNVWHFCRHDNIHPYAIRRHDGIWINTRYFWMTQPRQKRERRGRRARR